MKTVLSTFDRHDDARAAAEGLRQQGLALEDVSVHHRPPVRDPSSASRIDDLASGGLFTDFYALLENLFGAGSGITRNLDDGIPAGGSVVVVRSGSDDEAARAQAFLLEAGAARQFAIPREGDLG